MRSQADRDEITLAISTSLAVFVLVLVLGGVVAVLVGHESVAGPVVLACAGVVAVSYLWRHRRP